MKKNIFLAWLLFLAFHLGYGQSDSSQNVVTPTRKLRVDHFGYVIRNIDTLTLVDLGVNFNKGQRFFDPMKANVKRIGYYENLDGKVYIPLKGTKNASYSAIIKAVQVGDNPKRLLKGDPMSLTPYLEATEASNSLLQLSKKQRNTGNLIAGVGMPLGLFGGIALASSSNDNFYVGIGAGATTLVVTGIVGAVKIIGSYKTLFRACKAYNKSILTEGAITSPKDVTSNLLVFEKREVIIGTQEQYKTASGGRVNVGQVKYSYDYQFVGFKPGGKGTARKFTCEALKPYLTKYKESNKKYNKAKRNRTLKYVGGAMVVGGLATAIIGIAAEQGSPLKTVGSFGFLGMITGFVIRAATPIKPHLIEGIYLHNCAVASGDISFVPTFRKNKLDKFKPSFYNLGFDNSTNMALGNSTYPALKLGWSF